MLVPRLPFPEISSSPSFQQRQEVIRKIRAAIRGSWDDVVTIYERQTDVAHKAKITKMGYTALHIAISDGKEDIVEKLVKTVSNVPGALEVKNNAGNTPLHIAAATGNIRMCMCIVESINTGSQLVEIRNNDGETPLFMAALYGKKDTFLYLNSLVYSNQNISRLFVRRTSDGNTILHCAIEGEYFDLAFQIIHLYKDDLVNSVNAEGITPLHVLATKPSAFRSGCKLGPWRGIIYECLYVDRLEADDKYRQPSPKKSHQQNYPPNYSNFVSFLRFMRRAVLVAIGANAEKPNNNSREEDQENPPNSRSTQKNGGQGNLFPDNYTNCYNFFKLLHGVILVFTGRGHAWIIELLKQKEKHRWSVQVLNELLKVGSTDDSGDNPYFLENEDGSHNELQLENYKEHVSQGHAWITELLKQKLQKHQCSVQVLNELLKDVGSMDDSGDIPYLLENEYGIRKELQLENYKEHDSQVNKENENKESSKIKKIKKETALLIAAKNGITEMVQRILENFPMAVYDEDENKKNVVLLAVENRQAEVYKLLLDKHSQNESMFRKVDSDGNGVLHLAATKGDHKPWPVPGDALQMQWEIKWNKFVERSMPPNFFARYNKKRETPEDIFTETHKGLVKSGCEWLIKTSESCSVVVALIATVAFATSTTLPGGTNDDNGKPTLENQPAFKIFAIASLIALSFSVTSLAMFLAILTSRFQENYFGKVLPWKLLLGLTSLFLSIASMLVSFCAGHFCALRDTLKYASFPVYALTCVPVTFFASAQFPLYIDLIHATFRNPFGKKRSKLDSSN